MTVQVEVFEAVTPAFVRHELWPLYRSVFGDFDDYEAWRDDVWARHSARRGFRIALARTDDDLAGFGYGYTGEHGQWWTDTAASVLHPDVASDWLGGHFELVSIGVAASARGASVGRRLLTALTDGLEHARWLLMTSSDSGGPRPPAVSLGRLGRDRTGLLDRPRHHGAFLAGDVTWRRRLPVEHHAGSSHQDPAG